MDPDTTVHVDRKRPPRLTFTETGGQPILAYHDENWEENPDVPERSGPIGWVLHVQHYQPFPMGFPAFEEASEALEEAKRYLKIRSPTHIGYRGGVSVFAANGPTTATATT